MSKTLKNSNPHGHDLRELDKLLDQYQLVDLVQTGGMSSVFKANQVSLNRTVAIKFLPKNYFKHEEFSARFKQEAELMAQLHHPNIVQIYDFGELSDGNLFIVMEYIEGHDLSQLMDEEISPSHAVNLAIKLTDTISYLHKRGIYHRDIKPGNIINDQEGCPKLTDFGIAKPTKFKETGLQLTLTGIIIGTIDYMSPEQRKGNVIEQSDLYSIATLLYELIMKSLPHGVYKHITSKYPCATGLDPILVKALESNPNERTQTAEEFSSQLKDFIGQYRGLEIFEKSHKCSAFKMCQTRPSEPVKFANQAYPCSKCFRKQNIDNPIKKVIKKLTQYLTN